MRAIRIQDHPRLAIKNPIQAGLSHYAALHDTDDGFKPGNSGSRARFLVVVLVSNHKVIVDLVSNHFFPVLRSGSPALQLPRVQLLYFSSLAAHQPVLVAGDVPQYPSEYPDHGSARQQPQRASVMHVDVATLLALRFVE